MIDPIDCRDLNEETLIQCPMCLEIPLFPIIFPCGHLECHSCYSSDFRLRARRYGLTFFTPCPICRSDVQPEKVTTAEIELKRHPTSKVSLFYKNLHVRCRNRRCNRFIQYPVLTQHETSECPNRKLNHNFISHPDQEELDAIINIVKLQRGRLLYGRNSTVPVEEPNWPETIFACLCMFLGFIPLAILFIYPFYYIIFYLYTCIAFLISFR